MDRGNELCQFESLLEKMTPADFDGHSEFDKLSPEERLMWLTQCICFVQEVRTTIPSKKIEGNPKMPSPGRR
jgi:hypothetical protein